MLARISSTKAVERSGRLAGLVGFWVLAYVILLPYQWEPIQFLRFGIADVCLFLYVLLGFSRMRIRRTAWGFWHAALFVLFALGLFVGTVYAGVLTRYVLVNKALGMLILLTAYWAITTEVSTWAQLRKVMRMFVLGVTFQNLFAIAALMASYLAGFKFSFVNYDNERLSGMMYDPNAYGGLLVTALAFNVVGSSGTAQPITRGLTRLFCNVTLVIGVALTFSRSAWMSLAAVWVIYLFRRPIAALKMAAILSPGVPVLAMLVAFNVISPERTLQRHGTIEERVELMHSSLEQFEKYPVLGMGLGRFRDYNGLIVHNTPLWFLVDFGLVGVGVFLGFLGWSFVSAFRTYLVAPRAARPYVHALMAANAGMLGLSMGIEAFYQRHWWMCFALIAASRMAAKRSSAPKLGMSGTVRPVAPAPVPRLRPAWALNARLHQ